jgi:branched-chain amino acid transport system permease protein
MQLLVGGLISGLAQGLLYGLLGFATILLYKSTGVANFAVGTMATVSVFAAYKVLTAGFSMGPSIALGLVIAVVIGVVVYWLAIAPNGSAGHLNLTIRTFGVNLVVLAAINATWAVGQPFEFPSAFSNGAAFTIGGVTVVWNTLGALVVAAALVVTFVVIFRFTKVGLLFLALAARPDVARLLGVKVRRLTVIAWAMSAVVAACVAFLVAPASRLSSEMLDPYLLLGFSAAIVGGLTSLYGVFIAGVAIGVIGNISALYTTSDIGTLVIFAILLVMLIVRPSGIFGAPAIERL